MIKTCVQCGRPFTRTTNQVTCRPRCRLLYRAQRRRLRAQQKKPKRICIVCGAPFIGRQGAGQACSEKCYITHRRMVWRQVKATQRSNQRMTRGEASDEQQAF